MSYRLETDESRVDKEFWKNIKLMSLIGDRDNEKIEWSFITGDFNTIYVITATVTDMTKAIRSRGSKLTYRIFVFLIWSLSLQREYTDTETAFLLGSIILYD